VQPRRRTARARRAHPPPLSPALASLTPQPAPCCDDNMELRHRPSADAPASAADSRPERGDLPRPHHAHVDRRLIREEVAGYDADADFKHGVHKPPGYLPDDTGRLATRSQDPGRPLEVHHDSGNAQPSDLPPRSLEIREQDGNEIPRAFVDRPDIRHPGVETPLDRYEDVLRSPDGSRIPCWNGPPSREQTSQGRIRDCGVVAALGAVAGHRPDDIARRVHGQPDGTYRVVLNEARRTEDGAVPTRREIELTVTPELPVNATSPHIPAGTQAEGGAAWAPLVEKALAGVDQTWSPQRRAAWLDDWSSLVTNQDQNVENQLSGPLPKGYVRLGLGSDAWDRAEVLTQLTGQDAVVREFPSGADEWLINRIVRDQLSEGKPVLASTRHLEDHERKLPHDLIPGHVYEVTGIEKGKIILRNPWNSDHPEPLETQAFARTMKPWYTTLS
jgi:hypothetical protein